MKDIITIMQEQGFEIPEGKEADIRKALSGNYITTAEADKKLSKLEGERDQYKAQSEAISQQLDELKGKDPEGLEKRLEEAQNKLKAIQDEYADKASKRERADALDKKLAEFKFSSNAAKEAVRSKLIAKEMKLENGVLIGLDDYMKEIRQTDADAFAPDTTPAKFTTPSGGASDDKVTKESILAIRDTVERRAMMEKHFDLFA